MSANETKPNTLYRLVDTFNRVTISGHHSLIGAEKASRRHSRAVERSNGKGHYIPKRIERWEPAEGWRVVPDEEVTEVRLHLDSGR